MAHLGSRAPTEEEFATFVHVAWPSLYRTALLMTGDHGLAEDLAQNALAATYSRWHRLREPAAARAYARRAVVNGTTSWFRRPTNRDERPTEVLPERAGSGSLDVAVGDRLDVLAALRALAPRQRAVVVLRFYDDLSVQETADALGISAGTVKSQTSVALARLRELLGDDVTLTTRGAGAPGPLLGGHHA